MPGVTNVFDVGSFMSSPDSTIIAPKENKVRGTLDSIYYIASEAGYSLKDYVALFPDEALLAVERNIAEWSKLMTDAVVNGYIIAEDGRRLLMNKFVVDIFKDRMRRSEAELALVTRLASARGATPKEKILNTLYNSALDGDTRSIQMIMDRADGRVVERKDGGVFENNPYLLNVYKIVHSMFDKQLEVINSGPGRKMICCSRRSGKSHMDVGIIMMTAMLTPNTPCLFIGPTHKRAEKLFKIPVEQMITDLQLTDSRGERLKWNRLENGSFVDIRGLSNIRDPDSARGPKYKIIVIDEFFHLKSELVQYYMDEVLEPMQMDYGAEGFMFLMTGTPPKKRKSFGEELWKERGYQKWKWTWRDNPYIVDGENYLKKLCEEKGIDQSSPFFQREYEGNWIYDTDFLLYPDYYTYDAEAGPPTGLNVTKVAIGIDYGSIDHTAVLGIAWDADKLQGYEFFSTKFNTLSVGGQGQLQVLKRKIEECWTQAMSMFPTLSVTERNKRIIWSADVNGMSKEFTAELERDVRLPIAPQLRLQIKEAHRTDGIMLQDKTRDLLRTGAVLLKQGGMTVVECELTSMKLDVHGNPTNEIDHKNFHPDLLACLRYAAWDLYGKTDINATMKEDGDITYGGSFEADFKMSRVPVSMDGRLVATAGIAAQKSNIPKMRATSNMGAHTVGDATKFGPDIYKYPNGAKPLGERMREARDERERYGEEEAKLSGNSDPGQP